MKVIHVLDEISKKNISLFRVAQIISKYSFLDKKFKLATENNKDKESNVIVFKNSIKNFFYFSKIFFFSKKKFPRSCSYTWLVETYTFPFSFEMQFSEYSCCDATAWNAFECCIEKQIYI